MLRRFRPVLSVLVLLGIWEGLALSGWLPAFALPTLQSVGGVAVRLWTVGYGGQSLLADIWVSTARIGVGFVLAVFVGVPIGLLMASSDFVFEAIDPIIQFVRPVPPLAYIPLLVAWFGIGEAPKILVILLGTLPVIIISTISGVRSAPPAWLDVARTLGLSPSAIFWRVRLPAALPEIFTGMRVGIGIAWTCLMAAEILAASVGLGWLVQYAGQEVQIGIIFVGIAAIGFLGYLMELLIRLLESVLVPWKGRGAA